MKNVPYRIYLSESETSKQWYNILADMKELPDPYLHPATFKPVEPEVMKQIFCEELCAQEMNTTDRYIDIPQELQEFYKIFRPSVNPRVQPRKSTRHSGKNLLQV